METQHTDRDPQGTRRRILEAAFQEIYRHGFQGTRMDDIVRATGLTKGALYYYFPNKQALGYAVVDEVVLDRLLQLWHPLSASERPLDQIIAIIEHLEDYVGEQIYTLGCPLNNLAQEMSPLDEGFRSRIDEVYRQWHEALVAALDKACRQGQIAAEVDSDQTATFLIGAMSGCIGLAKNAQSGTVLRQCGYGLVSYLNSLRLHS